MTAANAERRTKSARELAEQFQISERHVRRLIAEPRTEFLSRAAERRETAARLRAEGMKYAQIADEMGCSTGAVGRLLHDVRKHEKRQDANGQ